jgi:2'-5' RNA ligase
VRLFVAVACDPEAARAVAAWQAELRSRLAGVSWVRPENFHLTLRFLGEVADDRVDAAARAVAAAAARRAPFDLTLRGAGAFPRALWVGADSPALAGLAAAVEEELRRAGFGAADKPFRPHLTIGRLRQPQPGLRALAQAKADAAWGSWRVEEAALMRSRLDPRGAVHTPLLRAPLGRAMLD